MIIIICFILLIIYVLLCYYVLFDNWRYDRSGAVVDEVILAHG